MCVGFICAATRSRHFVCVECVDNACLLNVWTKHGSRSCMTVGVAWQFVSGIAGCFYNVMGFPMHAFCVRMTALIDEVSQFRALAPIR